MDNLERLIKRICTSLQCHVLITAHPEREADETEGGSKIMAGTLGKKLAPKLPKNFSDIILTKRIGKRFTWSTVASGYVLKARNFAFEDDLPPDVGPGIEVWKSRGGLILP
jgi:hypothetical protein